MKNIQKISALLAASATLSMAGVINVYDEEAKKPTASLNLTTIDSLTFSGKAEKKAMNFSGKTKQKAIKLADMDHIDFKLKDKSKETMTVTVGEGIYEGTHTFKLSDIKNIEIIEMDSDKDSDGDGLTDLDEIYKYGTSPKSADTDGDGWSDGEELADGMYSAKNPTKFNPLIADLPGLEIVLKKTPSIMLNITTSEAQTENVTVSEGNDITTTNTTSYEQTRSADIMNSWGISTTQGWEVGGGANAKWVGNVSVGYNGSYTTSTGMTWSSSEEKSVAQSYEKAVSNETSKGSEVSGATVCMQVELKNTSDVAFTIDELKLSASIYDVRDAGTYKILAELDREGGWSSLTIQPKKSSPAKFCNGNVSVELIEDLIYNTSSMVLGSSTQKITMNAENDFTVNYTKVASKTADITIDYGPGTKGYSSMRYHVATQFRYNFDNKKNEDVYDSLISLAELLRIAHVDFKQDSVVGPNKKKLYGLASIDNYKFNLADSAMWYVSIQRAADFQRGIDNLIEQFSYSKGSFDIEKIFVGAGDAVHIFYSKDHDHDKVPLVTEHMYGSSDDKEDSDNDTVPDFEEIFGWCRSGKLIRPSSDTTACKKENTFYTNPTAINTDGDEFDDYSDPDPTRRSMFADATLSKLQVFALDPRDPEVQLTKEDVLLKLESELAKGRNFDLDIQAPSVFIKIEPKVNKVAQVKVKMGKFVQFVQPVEENNKSVYYYQTSQLSVLKKNAVEIQVLSEDNAKTETYTLSISSSLIPPTNLSLGKSEKRDSIIVNFNCSTKDPRVKGYVILRGDKNAKLPDSIKAGAKLFDNKSYDGFTRFLIEKANQSSYSNYVKEGSPYYTYRVYAYTLEGDDSTMVFSTGTEQKVRSVGRIKVEYSMDDFGAEYQTISGSRADITAKVSLHEGSSEAAKKLFSWEGYDLEAGCLSSSETVIFFSKRDCKADKEDRTPDYSTRTDTIGSGGLFLYFDVDADKNSKHVYAKRGISWPYAKMAEVLQDENENTSIATGKDGAAPKQGKQMKFLVGQSGIEYDNDDNKCSGDANGCGNLPHTGYKFTFKYSWVDDDENY